MAVPHQQLRKLLNSDDATSPSSATYAVKSSYSGFADFKAITFIAKITGATGGTLDVVVEHSPDEGTTWYEYIHFAQAAAAASAKRYVYGPALNDSLTEVGENNASGSTLTTTIVLGAGQVAGSHWFDMMRVKFVAGTGTSAGAAQVVNVVCFADSGAA